jgi:uncharacterized protein (TIGR03083 family)
LRSLDEGQASLPVPTCPQWTVADLACHLYGVPDDILNGRLENPGSNEWTAAQVDRHRPKPLAVIADQWEAAAEPFDAVLLVIPDPTNLQIVMDSVTHEYDLRLAVGQPGPQESAALDIGAEFLLRGLRPALPHLAAQIEDPAISGFERLRILTGRRSAGQLAALGIDAAVLERHLTGSVLSVTPIDIVERSIA